PTECHANPLSHFPAECRALGTGTGPLIGYPIQNTVLIWLGKSLSDNVAIAQLFLAQVIETQVRRNAIDPGIEGTFEAKPPQVAVCAQKRLLVNILSVFIRTGDIQSQTQHHAIVMPDQLFKG